MERTGDYRLLRKRDQARGGIAASIIELIDMDDMNSFYTILGNLLEEELPVPPPHVTWLTFGCAEGIGVPDVHALQALQALQLRGLHPDETKRMPVSS